MFKKSIALFIIAIFAIVPSVMAEGFSVGKKDCFEYSLGEERPGSGVQVLIIHTAKPLTVTKDGKITSDKTSTEGNDLGRSLYGRLHKLPDVGTVIVASREIAIVKYPFPRGWDQVLPECLKVVEEVLCGK